jgi:hypothetical protein
MVPRDFIIIFEHLSIIEFFGPPHYPNLAFFLQVLGIAGIEGIQDTPRFWAGALLC